MLHERNGYLKNLPSSICQETMPRNIPTKHGFNWCNYSSHFSKDSFLKIFCFVAAKIKVALLLSQCLRVQLLIFFKCRPEKLDIMWFCDAHLFSMGVFEHTRPSVLLH